MSNKVAAPWLCILCVVCQKPPPSVRLFLAQCLTVLTQSNKVVLTKEELEEFKKEFSQVSHRNFPPLPLTGFRQVDTDNSGFIDISEGAKKRVAFLVAVCIPKCQSVEKIQK